VRSNGNAPGVMVHGGPTVAVAVAGRGVGVVVAGGDVGVALAATGVAVGDCDGGRVEVGVPALIVAVLEATAVGEGSAGPFEPPPHPAPHNAPIRRRAVHHPPRRMRSIPTSGPVETATEIRCVDTSRTSPWQRISCAARRWHESRRPQMANMK
jgi:hypothetical protein